MDTIPNALMRDSCKIGMVVFCRYRLKRRPLAFTLRLDVSTLIEEQLYDIIVISYRGRLKAGP